MTQHKLTVMMRNPPMEMMNRASVSDRCLTVQPARAQNNSNILFHEFYSILKSSLNLYIFMVFRIFVSMQCCFRLFLCTVVVVGIFSFVFDEVFSFLYHFVRKHFVFFRLSILIPRTVLCCLIYAFSSSTNFYNCSIVVFF